MAPTTLTAASKRGLASVSVMCVVAALASPAFGSLLRTKPSARDFDRVQAAGRAALFKLGLVDTRNCDRTDLRCIDRATTAEAAAFDNGVRVERSVARTLERGKCKTAMLGRAAGYAKHSTNVRKARTACVPGSSSPPQASTTTAADHGAEGWTARS